ncbi:MAG: diguanylate cyclase [Clostridia bacterium]|nr:diguanylate cyclase [Clostridia bacterium]
MYYSAIAILALLVLVIQNQDVMLNRNGAFQRPAWTLYRRFLLGISVYYITDILWGVLEHYKLAVPLFIDTSVYFVAMAGSIFAWAHYIVCYLGEEENTFGRILVLFGRVFAVLVSALVVANIFVPLLFTVDSNCVYKACGGRYVVLGVQIAMLLLVSIYAVTAYLRRHTQQKQRYRTLALFGIITAVFLFAQLWFPFLPLYSIAYMLGTCMLHAFVVGEEKEEYRLNLEETKKIVELKKSFYSLLDNMPASSYSKDAQTGVYLACNQAFADYVQKPTPADVVGLTDYDLFDNATAEHFLNYDKVALGMEKPFIYFETAKDVDGQIHNFQTTKFKFNNEDGTLCVLGMSLDVTEMERVKEENAKTLAAYQEMLQESSVYGNVISAIAEDYFNIFYLDINTEEYIEYGSRTTDGKRTVETHGSQFFHTIKEDAAKLVYEEDRKGLVETLTRENILQELAQADVFKYNYRLMLEGEPTYVSLKVTRIPGDENHLVIGITNVDGEMKTRLAAEQVREESKAYLRLSAFSRSLLVLYVIDPETEAFTEFSSTEDYAEFGIAKKGTDFFEETYKNAQNAVYEEDKEHFFAHFTKENIRQAIELDGIFVLDYRLMFGGKPTYIRLKASEVEEDGKTLLVLGIENVDRYIRREQQQAYDLSVAREMATKDALTGVKNKLAFDHAEEQLNAQIRECKAPAFAIVVCDINGLKEVNDNEGHQAGDMLIRAACEVICNVFRHSPVFRIGGDEFAVICRGQDYENIEKLLEEMDALNSANKLTGDVQVAYGMARHEEGAGTAEVFELADQRMYENKAALKA